MAALSRVAMVATMGLVAALLSSTAMSSEPSFISMVTDNTQLPDGLSYDFHAESCPNLENMVREAVQAAIAKDVGVIAGLLRILFHDCFPQGCDASLLLTGANSELKMPQNGGLRQSALDLIESIRATVHRACGPTVSCADITTLATKQAVMQSGVPGYDLPLGRKDSLAPATTQQVGILPGPDFRIDQLVKTFADRGFDKVELVALSGAHTIGKASCGSFKNRAGENADFVLRLQGLCARMPNRLQDLDVDTPNIFDHKYYKNLQLPENPDQCSTRLTLWSQILEPSPIRLTKLRAPPLGILGSVKQQSSHKQLHLRQRLELRVPTSRGERRGEERTMKSVKPMSIIIPSTFFAPCCSYGMHGGPYQAMEEAGCSYVMHGGPYQAMEEAGCSYGGSHVLPLFRNIRCFRFVKDMYLDTF